ncbi:hypothetical protein STEG23_006523, partial [Scotinomys teguina]
LVYTTGFSGTVQFKLIFQNSFKSKMWESSSDITELVPGKLEARESVPCKTITSGSTKLEMFVHHRSNLDQVIGTETLAFTYSDLEACQSLTDVCGQLGEIKLQIPNHQTSSQDHIFTWLCALDICAFLAMHLAAGESSDGNTSTAFQNKHDRP